MTSDADKAPTILLTDDIYNEAEWGYGIRSPEKAFKWFKLLLLNDSDVPEELKASEQLVDAQKTLSRTGQDAVYVVACYLRHLWRHALRCIKREKGVKHVDACRFRIILTVPAIWPPYATNRMRKAAEIAGMLDQRSSGETVLDFISEPEAAAVATIGDMDKRNDIKKGDTIVICDAGGGTDLISYVVTRYNPFVFDEHVRGEGGLCGAIFLDENFESLIKDKVGASAWNKSDAFQKQKTMNNEWENCIKRQFDGLDQGRPWLVTLPENCTVRRCGTSKKRTRDMEITS
ncbi:hypothetical protein K4F52_005911 [Lecanicillium sp. MT-2017a]|nr:hypothetical protein K4F52_005911 [Lecanicillium sp. MT-2017a]